MTKPASAPPADKWIALEANLKARYDVCEDFAATPSSILLAVLNAVAAVNDDTTAQLADIAASAQVREVEALPDNREMIRELNYSLWMTGNGGCEPPQDWQDKWHAEHPEPAPEPAPVNAQELGKAVGRWIEPAPVAQGDAPPFAIVNFVAYAGPQDLCAALSKAEASLAACRADADAAWIAAIDEAHQQTDAGLCIGYRAADRVKRRARELLAVLPLAGEVAHG